MSDNVHAVRRRLTASLHRQFIDTMAAREMPQAVTLDALLLTNGDALDFLGVWRQVCVGTVDCTRLQPPAPRRQPAMTRTRLRRVDAVRLRLLPPEAVAVLEHISDLRRQPISKVLRIFMRKFNGNVHAYWMATCGDRPAPLVRVGQRMVTSAELQQQLRKP